MKKPSRKIKIFGDSYWEFYQRLSAEGQEQVDVVLELLRTTDVTGTEYEPTPTLIPDISEIRVENNTGYYRIFLYFGKVNEIIILNGAEYNLAD